MRSKKKNLSQIFTFNFEKKGQYFEIWEHLFYSYVPIKPPYIYNNNN